MTFVVIQEKRITGRFRWRAGKLECEVEIGVTPGEPYKLWRVARPKDHTIAALDKFEADLVQTAKQDATA